MRRSSVSALALMAGLVGTGLAQDPAATEGAEEVVVTVQLRKQRLVEVPMAVTAYSGSNLEQLGITKFDDLSLIVPGLEVQEQSANNPGFVIRGITSDSGAAQAEPRIAVFQDGVSASRNRGTYMELFDLERVEVARGPQATLFGRGALIGAINVIQNKADVDETIVSGTVGAGSHDFFRAEAVLNVPIAPGEFAVRVAGAHRERDGFTDNLLGGDALGGVEVNAFRIAAAWQASPDLRFDLIYNQHRDDDAGTPFKSGTYAPPGGSLSPFANAAALNRFAEGFEGNREIGLDRKVETGTLIATWDISDDLTLTSITGIREFDSLEVFDVDGSAVPLMQGAEDASAEQVSQELRLAFDNGSAVSGFVGVSYFEEEGAQRGPAQYDERYALAFATGFLTGPEIPDLATIRAIDLGILTGVTGSPFLAEILYGQLDPGHSEFYRNTSDTQSWDLFADVTWKVSDDFELNGGLRYTADDKTSTLEAGNLGSPSVLGGLLIANGLQERAGAALAAGDIPTALALRDQAIATITALVSPLLPNPEVGLFIQPQELISRSGEFDGFTWRTTARYAVEDNVSLWASYARGRTPNVLAVTPGNLPGTTASSETLPAELVDSYEIGARAVGLADGTLDAEGSVYYYEYDDFQTLQFIGGAIRALNAGEATAYGFEGALQWRPVDALTIFGTYGYNHARFETGAREGNRFRLSPDHTVSLGLTYEVPVAGVGIFSLTPTYSWQSEVYFDDNNDRSDLQPSTLPGLRDRAVDEVQGDYGLLNLRLRYETEEGDWAITGFVNNLTDKDYLLDAGNLGDSLTIPTFIRGIPRTAGVELSARF